MQYPPQVQTLIDAVNALPGIAGCFCGPKPLEDVDVDQLSLPGEFGDLPQAVIRRTDGGRKDEVMIQVEVIFDRSAGAWLSLEFLAWWVRDWGRSGHDIQMRPMSLPPKAGVIQLGRMLKFFIEYFLIDDGDSYEKTLGVAAEMGESIADSHRMYAECFANPVEFTGDVENM